VPEHDERVVAKDDSALGVPAHDRHRIPHWMREQRPLPRRRGLPDTHPDEPMAGPTEERVR
jgi:hypothetical protein